MSKSRFAWMIIASLLGACAADVGEPLSSTGPAASKGDSHHADGTGAEPDQEVFEGVRVSGGHVLGLQRPGAQVETEGMVLFPGSAAQCESIQEELAPTLRDCSPGEMIITTPRFRMQPGDAPYAVEARFTEPPVPGLEWEEGRLLMFVWRRPAGAPDTGWERVLTEETTEGRQVPVDGYRRIEISSDGARLVARDPEGNAVEYLQPSEQPMHYLATVVPGPLYTFEPNESSLDGYAYGYRVDTCAAEAGRCGGTE